MRLTRLLGVLAISLHAQTFEVASVKPSNANEQPWSNFPLGPGDVYVPNGGYFNATAQPLFIFIAFAYKIQGSQLQEIIRQLPAWASDEPYGIQARAGGNPGKDDMRLMMRTLLAERFGFKMHAEKRDQPVAVMTVAKAGTLGPQLRTHQEDPPCLTTTDTMGRAAAPSQWTPEGYPILCNGLLPLPPKDPAHARFGGRNVTLAFLAQSLSGGSGLGRQLVDGTGLPGKYDFMVEFSVPRRAEAGIGAGAGLPPDLDARELSFEDAFRSQLGLKIEFRKAPLEVTIVDHVERPSAN